MPTNWSFQLHKLEYVPARPSQLYGDGECIFSREAKVVSVPSIHMFGRSSNGSSVCAKIRNVYPYFFVELPPPYEAEPEFICQVGAGIDFALTGNNDPCKSTVHRIDLVQARILYHYEQNPRPFLKISLYSPYDVKRATEAFQTGRIGQQAMRCYESHIPLILQFMIDFNLFGMSDVSLEDANVIENDAADRASSCDVELECSSSQILNPRKLARFSNLRHDSKGTFPSQHVMPSVVAMLESLGLEGGSVSQPRSSQDLEDMNCLEKYSDIIKRIFIGEPKCFGKQVDILPKAFSYQENLTPSFDSSCWDRFSFGFNSQQIARASIGFKSELASQVEPPISELSQDNLDFGEIENILGDMMNNQSSDSDDMRINQFDGADDEEEDGHPIQLMNMWSEGTHETDSVLGLAEFSDIEANDSKYVHVGVPPTVQDLIKSLRQYKLPRTIHQEPFDGRPEPKVLPEKGPVTILPAEDPPITYDEAVIWLKENSARHTKEPIQKKDFVMSQIDGPTQKYSMGYDPNGPISSQLSATDNLSIFSVEYFGKSTGSLLSNPETDPVALISWYFLSSIAGQDIHLRGSIMIATDAKICRSNLKIVPDELALFQELIQLVDDLDPDVLVGYEIESRSWGHLQERAEILGIHLARSVSRSHQKRKIDASRPESEDPYASKRTSTFQVFGRICLNIWRIMKSDLTLRSYSFENVALQVLHQNFPKYRQPLLQDIFYGQTGDLKRLARPDIVIDYFSVRARGNIDLLVKTEVLNRTCEFARLYGVDFFSVISRGSQYKVESLMIRLAHLDNFIAYSPSKQDIVKMAAPEALPLVMEPLSNFYVDPVVVLDFQALYPSIIIAYNYCFSTCLGRVNETSYPKVFGASHIQDEAPRIENVEDLTVSPNKIAFVKKNVREGILPKMLSELLQARILVKGELAGESDLMRRKILDARQLGIKLLSNVTYGYTSASFSGRMPCIEIADSIVQTGRATLEQAVKLIHEREEWDAKVVYGDTDSLFVKLAGRTLEEAHRLGREIASFISAKCPPPVKLKFEKVYMPCLLMSKKRYVGFKYENPKDAEPAFDAKGIETVRRDTCPLVSKVLEKTLKILARTRDIFQVRTYVQRQFQKVLAGGSLNLSDFVFSREVRLGTYAADRAPPAAEDEELDVEAGQRPHSAIIALQRMQQDKRDVPQYGERVPYVIVYGQGNDKLRELVASPDELLINPDLRINSVYYIVKCLIPALNRALGLCGVDTQEWYASLPRPTSRPINAAAFVRLGKATKSNDTSIDTFFKSSACIICRNRDAHELVRNGGSIRLCRECSSASMQPECLANLFYRLEAIDKELSAFHMINANHHGLCGGPIADLNVADVSKLETCWSFDCPIFWKALSLRQNECQVRTSLISALRALGASL